ncbi:MAG: hypothetical protein WAN48_12175 [Actinomycetes bacterium]
MTHNGLPPHPLSRRQFFTVVGGSALGLLLPDSASAADRAALAAGSMRLTGARPLRLAMHVHGSWSEGLGSWDAQFTQAALNKIDVLYLTDHDFRATGYRYLSTLADPKWVRSTTGSLARQDSTVTAGAVRLLAESASTTSAASVTLAVEPKPTAFNRLRTGIAGQSLRHTIGASTLSNGATYEIVVALSYHPARGGRPAGNYELCYRFGAFGSSRFTENSGLRGVVTAPRQASGTTVTLTPTADVAALWPDMLAMDNCFYGLAFVAKSPKKGAVADVNISAVQFVRTQNDPAHVTANQQALISSYAPRFPTVTARATTEVSRHLPDMNPFGVPQFFSDYALDTSTNHDAFYRDLVDDIHSGRGVISWNHPFGYNGGPLLSSTERAAKRRTVYDQLRAVDVYGADILEVGYTLRGNVDTNSHLALWDTFSRHGRFLTGNGTSDDHSGLTWKSMGNGFVTGVWASSAADPDIVSALSSGRAYLSHCGRWVDGELDMLVDDVVPMGKASVSSAATRQLKVYISNLPTGGRVEIVSGPVDSSTARDPGMKVLKTLTASSFVQGVASLPVSTTTSTFVRATVKRADGTVIGSGNPIWLLRQAPPGGIPAARAA